MDVFFLLTGPTYTVPVLRHFGSRSLRRWTFTGGRLFLLDDCGLCLDGDRFILFPAMAVCKRPATAMNVSDAVILKRLAQADTGRHAEYRKRLRKKCERNGCSMNAQRPHGGVWYCTNCLKEMHPEAAAEALELRMQREPKRICNGKSKTLHAVVRQSADPAQQSANFSILFQSNIIAIFAFALCRLRLWTATLLLGVRSATAVVATTAT